nr:7TM diverse intracellular signaling domain-containing protein [Sulfurovum sp. bin170]
MLYLFYFGTLFFILIFTLFLFITLKDSIYIYYVGYIFFTAVYVLAYSGLTYHIDLVPWIKELNISVPLFSIFFILFSTKFLDTRFYLPRIDKVLNGVSILLMLTIPLIILDYDPWFNIVTKGTTLLTPLLIYASIYVFIKGHTEVKYYIIALVTYMVSMLTLSLMTQGFIANSDINHYAFVYGSYFEIVFFSFVLANRFHKIQNEIITIKAKNEQLLEAKVKARTTKIRSLLKEKELLLREVYHRVKNNFQMVIGLLWIEASRKKNDEHEQALLEMINRIKSMSLVHQYLLDSNTYSEIRSEEYLLKIIEGTEQIYSRQNIRIDKEIDHCILEMDSAMALAVIVNEVLTNAVKHHHQQESCHIYFSFKKQNSDIIVTIKDNGLGFLPNEQSDGFGLKMVKQFAKKLKSSHIEFSFDRGTTFVLSFKCFL